MGSTPPPPLGRSLNQISCEQAHNLKSFLSFSAEDNEFNPGVLIILAIIFLLLILFAVKVFVDKAAASSKWKAICSRQKMRRMLESVCTFKCVSLSKGFTKSSVRRTRRTASLSVQTEFDSTSVKDISDEGEPKKTFDTKLVSFSKPSTVSKSVKDTPASFTCKPRDQDVHCTRLHGCAANSLEVECTCSKLGYSGAKTNPSMEFDEESGSGRT